MELGLIEIWAGVVSVIGGGLWWWLWKLETELQQTKLDLARNYHPKEELRQVVQDALFPIKEELARLARLLERRRDEE